MKTHYNLPHPEALPGEVWMTNTTKDEFYKCAHSTKRMGNVAFDLSGNPIINHGGWYDLYPLFVKAEEMDSKNISYPTPFLSSNIELFSTIEKFRSI